MSSGEGGSAGTGGWSPEQQAAFVTARDLVAAVVAAYSAQIGTAGTPELAERLRGERAAYVELRDRLTAGDTELVARIRAEYPAVLTRLREQA